MAAVVFIFRLPRVGRGFRRVYWPAQHVWVLVYWLSLRKTVLWFTVNPVGDWRSGDAPRARPFLRVAPGLQCYADATLEATHQGEYSTRALLLSRDSKGAPANWLPSKKSGINQVGGDDEATTLPAPCCSQLP